MAATTSAAANPKEAGYRVGDLIIDIGRQRVTRDQTELPLSQLSFELLLTLTRAAPNMVSFDQLMERVWAGLVVTPETVSQRVKLVRDALEDDSHAPRYIGGVRGRGYRMVADVAPIAPAEHEPLTESSASGAPTPPAPPGRRPHQRLRLGLALTFALAAGIMLVAAGAWRFYPREATHPAEAASVTVAAPKTIAVLPLIDVSPGGGNAYLGDGLAQELSGRLARIPGLRVASQTSTFSFRGAHADVRTIARTLGVRHVLEGSVRREGDHLRVRAQLIDARTGYDVWSQSYDRQWKDLLTIEDDLARSIVQTLQVVLSSDIEQRLAQPPTAYLKAFDLYLAGLAKLREPKDAAQLQEAEGLFQEALAIDPRFPLAYAGLCESHAISYERQRDPALARQAEAACKRALTADSSLREVDMALAHLYLVSGSHEQAAAIYRDAVRKNPADADAYIGLAEAYAGQSRLNEAEVAFRRALEAEPDYAEAHTQFATFLFQHGRVGPAIGHFRRVTEVAPSALAFSNLGAALEMSGDLAGAAQAFERSLELEPSPSAFSNSGTVYYYQGRFADAVRMYRKATGLASGDHRVWGNLADALYQIPDSRAEAEREYHHAITLAESGLAVNPKDAVSWAQLAYYYARTGDADRAERYAARALELGPDVVYVHYYGALIALQHSNAAAAIDALRRAVELGYPMQLVRLAPEFADLHQDARFKQLIASAATPPG
jgi:TolB-like protein/Flp pilus assembly protein TadD/DNA-binding winged helix-turn-helix (wHTH) protein